VKRQYIGNLGKIENGIVAVTAYGVVDSIAIPLLFGLQTRIADLAKGYLSQQALLLQPESCGNSKQ